MNIKARGLPGTAWSMFLEREEPPDLETGTKWRGKLTNRSSPSLPPISFHYEEFPLGREKNFICSRFRSWESVLELIRIVDSFSFCARDAEKGKFHPLKRAAYIRGGCGRGCELWTRRQALGCRNEAISTLVTFLLILGCVPSSPIPFPLCSSLNLCEKGGNSRGEAIEMLKQKEASAYSYSKFTITVRIYLYKGR